MLLLLFIIIKRVRHLHANLLVQQGGDVALAAARIYSAQNRSIDFSLSLSVARRIKTIIFRPNEVLVIRFHELGNYNAKEKEDACLLITHFERCCVAHKRNLIPSRIPLTEDKQNHAMLVDST